MEEDLEQRLGEITQDEPSTPAAQQDEVEKLRRENARLQKKLGKYEPKPKPKPIVTPKPKPTSSNQPNHTIRNLVYTAIGVGLVSLLSYAGCQGCSDKGRSSSSSSNRSSSSSSYYNPPRKKTIHHSSGYSIITYSSPQELAQNTRYIKETQQKREAANRKKQEEEKRRRQEAWRTGNLKGIDKNLYEATKRGEEYKRRQNR